MKTHRRKFLASSGALVTGLNLASVSRAADALGEDWQKEPQKESQKTSQTKYRACVIGRTGRGDYGHALDRVFAGLDQVTVEAVADRDPSGLERAAASSGARRRYLDWREMLEKEKPDLVSIAPRHPDCHREMALGAIEVCRGIIIEKPFTETPAEADEILSAAGKRGVKILVAHNRRYTPGFVKLKALLAEGRLGEVRQVRCQGKQDARAGGEDLIVLGTHDFDLMRFYFGDPLWCQASVTAGGRGITRADVRKGQEPILVAGDDIHALFAFPRGVMLHWSSVKTGDHWNTRFGTREKWAFEILGTKAIAAYQSGLEFAFLDSPFLAGKEGEVRWGPLPEPEAFAWPEPARHPVRSLIHALETGGEPIASGRDGAWAIEMVAAIYESERVRARVEFPLTERGNPLLRF